MTKLLPITLAAILAGELRPKAVGEAGRSAVFNYVWPTNLDSATVGFEASQGILALAVTSHAGFDDAAGGGVNRHVWRSTGSS